MRLLLIRHGETVDNVAGNFAGVTDSALTAHGVLQTERLAAHLAARFPPSSVRAIFTSDLQRAARTAAAVGLACGRGDGAEIPLQVTPLLRERDFGALEGVPFRRCRANIEDVAESGASMRARARRFLHESLLPWLHPCDDDDVYIVVAHGLLLPQIYACLMDSVPPGKFTLDTALMTDTGAPPLRPFWLNTAYLELMIRALVPGAAALRMHVVRVNCTVHLKNLRRTRGGIGSAPHDDRQKTIQCYFGGKKL